MNKATFRVKNDTAHAMAQGLRKLVKGTMLRASAGFLGGLLIGAPVWAADTGGVSPNMLLIVDTSGSMGSYVSGTGKTRMGNVQEALHILLNNLNNVNVGLMRFSNPGGPVLYQIDNLDRNVNANADGTINVNATIEASTDDAQQVSKELADPLDPFGSLSDVIIYDDDKLDMARAVVGNADVFVRPIQSRDDDVEEMLWMAGGDNVLRGNSDLEVTHDDGNGARPHALGLRFTGVQVPDGATITNAYITMKVDNVGAGGVALMNITGEYGESDPFADIYQDVTNRTRTTSSVNWDLDNPAGSAFVVSPSLTSVVQDIVDHPNWKGDGTLISDMTFIIEPRDINVVAEHDLQAYDRGDFAPTLTVEYYVGTPPEERDAVTGLRFSTVDIPKGATIKSAYIDFVVAETDSTRETNLLIAGELAPNPVTYSDLAKIAGRSRTTAEVEWNAIEAWTTNNATKSTPDLAAIVQEITNQPDWCGGNAMAFMVAGKGLRSAWAYDAQNGLQPVLRVQYDKSTVVPGQSCARATMAKQVVHTRQDVEEDRSSVWVHSNDLDFQSTSRHVGVRFTDLPLPKNAKITEAYIEFSSWWNYSGNTTMKVQIEQIDDSPEFENRNGTVDSRTWSTAVDWNITEDWSEWQWVRTVDISSLVQSAVNRGGWILGNSMAFRVWKSSGTTRRAIAFNYDPVWAPRLVVHYQDDGTAAADVRLVREELLEQVDQLNTSGYTPIQDTLYEAALYYTGGKVTWGRKRGGPNDSGPHAYTRVSALDSMVDGTYRHILPPGCDLDSPGDEICKMENIAKFGGADPLYKSPINDWCQKESHIVLLTDGYANRPHSETLIKDFIGSTSCDSSVTTSEMCVKELAAYMFNNDMSDLQQRQIIRTHTIGFNFSSQWLKDIATAGGGQYKEASQASDLVTEVQAILSEVLKTNSTFVAPVAAINQFNRLNHRSEIYFAVFRPADTPSWPGNLKKYRLSPEDNTIIDFSSAAGQPAINEATGFFTEEAVSAWGGVADGPEVDVSGANSQLPAFDARKIYSYHSASTSKTLSDSVNVVSTTNTALTKSMFGVGGMTDAQFTEHLEWVIGKDIEDFDDDGITNENRYVIGDPLHSKPVAITYGGTQAEPDITVFFGSNNGLLHAVDSETGKEHFAFLPEALMPIQADLRTNLPSSEHIYGIDGDVTPWVKDGGDGSIDAENGDFVRIYFGMRRGGRNYYALDVTDRANPKLLWKIEGGTGDFANLGQSWSQPVLGNINIDGVETRVLYIAGGYDPDQDATETRAVDDMGAAIYIVNAETGALIWSGGNGLTYTVDFDDMNYSIPARLSVVDITSSGTDNMIFVGDVGGQLWRFDINNGAEVAKLITGGVIADLGVASGDNTPENNRRFYHSPDAALIVKDNQDKLAVTIGSGFQAHPLSTATKDRFYMILLDDVYTVPAAYTKLTEADLYLADDNDVGEGVTGAVALLEGAEGGQASQGESPAMVAHPLILRKSPVCPASDRKPRQENCWG